MTIEPELVGLAEGCCSASSPCNHQKADPTTICEACQAAAKFGLVDHPKPMFPRIGSTTDLWNDVIEAAAREVELDPIDSGPTRTRIAKMIRSLKREP